MHYRWERLATGVHRCRLPFLDVTVGLVAGSGGVLLVDCGTTCAEAAHLADDVADLTGRSVTHLVMTHHHFDHILGSAGFPTARTYGAPPVAVALTSGIDAVRDHALRYGARPDEVAQAATALRAPDQILTDGVIDLGDRTVNVTHPGRGHTDHDLVVAVAPTVAGEPTVVFCGDLVEESAEPAIDAGSDVAAWPDALDRVLDIGGPDARYVPGHGAVVEATFVRRQRDWLRNRC